MFFLPAVAMMVCVTALLTFPQLYELARRSLALPLGLQTHRRRTQNCDEVAYVCAWGSGRERPHVFYVCVCWRRAAERNVILGERPLALASRWPLTQIKLPQFSPSPLLPQPPSAAHCQALLFSHGRLLREHAHICGFRGWQQSVLRLSSFFTPAYPSTQIELFSHFLSSLFNHLPMPYLPIMSNFIVKSARAKHQVL